MDGALDQARVAFQILIAGNTLAGLTLVFLGHTIASYASYGAVERTDKVKSTHRWKAWLAFSGLTSALVAALLALGHNWVQEIWVVGLGLFFLLVAMGCVGVVAFKTAREVE